MMVKSRSVGRMQKSEFASQIEARRAARGENEVRNLIASPHHRENE